MSTEFISVWKKFCEFYEKYGAYKYGIKNLWGPYFREERDVVFHLARFCLEEFGLGYVHLDSPISHYYFDNYPEKDRTKYVDIDITDPKSFTTKNARHGIFVEVKWIYKDIFRLQKHFLDRRLKGIEDDLNKLYDQLKNNRCEHGFLCIIDEEPKSSGIDVNKVEWERRYSPVQILLLQPTGSQGA